MANDLGDSHVNSLGQGGALPANSTNFRTAGKIFVRSGKVVTYILYPENATKKLYIGLYNAAGTLLSSATGIGTLTTNYTPNFTGWITIKVRNAVTTNPTQRCWVNVTYEAPAVITNTNTATSGNTSSFWTGNGGTSDWNDPYNWEEGKVPVDTSRVVIEANAFPQPAVVGTANANHVFLEEGAHLFVHGTLNVQSIEGLSQVSGTGTLNQGAETISLATPVLAQFVVYPNPFEDRFDIAVNGVFEAETRLNAELMTADGRIIQTYSTTLPDLNGRLNADMESKPAGMYMLRIVGGESQVLRLVKQ
jgi:hypothetical protein